MKLLSVIFAYYAYALPWNTLSSLCGSEFAIQFKTNLDGNQYEAFPFSLATDACIAALNKECLKYNGKYKLLKVDGLTGLENIQCMLDVKLAIDEVPLLLEMDAMRVFGMRISGEGAVDLDLKKFQRLTYLNFTGFNEVQRLDFPRSLKSLTLDGVEKVQDDLALKMKKTLLEELIIYGNGHIDFGRQSTLQKVVWIADSTIEQQPHQLSALKKLSVLETSFTFANYPPTLKKLVMKREYLSGDMARQIHESNVHVQELFLSGNIDPEFFAYLSNVADAVHLDVKISKSLFTPLNINRIAGVKELYLQSFTGAATEEYNDLTWLARSFTDLEVLECEIGLFVDIEQLQTFLALLPNTLKTFKVTNWDSLLFSEAIRNDHDFMRKALIILLNEIADSNIVNDGDLLQFAEKFTGGRENCPLGGNEYVSELCQAMKKYHKAKRVKVKRNRVGFWQKMKQFFSKDSWASWFKGKPQRRSQPTKAVVVEDQQVVHQNQVTEAQQQIQHQRESVRQQPEIKPNSWRNWFTRKPEPAMISSETVSPVSNSAFEPSSDDEPGEEYNDRDFIDEFYSSDELQQDDQAPEQAFEDITEEQEH